MTSFVEPVHPHVRGEQHLEESRSVRAVHPPRAWGTGRARREPKPHLRGPSPCVGNSARLRRPAVAIAVHPHVRGEQFTSLALAQKTAIEVHPHVRGEQSPDTSAPGALTGPSPRAWEQPQNRTPPKLARGPSHVRGEQCKFQPTEPIGAGRSIPTCVGNRASPLENSTLVTVHPHVRGEQGHCG